jgi:hypothetical protein
MTNEQELSIAEGVLREAILSDTPEGFALYFEAVFNQPFPPHAHEWIRKLYAARANDRGYVQEAFRFSWKTSVLTVGFVSYRILLEPHKSNIIIQVKDESAEITASAISKVIAENPVFKWLAPNLSPDKDRGWGSKGFYIKRTDMDYGDWIRMCGRDPTFVGYGYTSDSIIGKHPNGCLVVDDIHNEENTASSRELQKVMNILTGTIFPTIDPKATWVVFVGTPWVKNDALGYAKSTGAFDNDVTPIYRDVDGRREYTWPAKFDEKEVEYLRQISGPIEFARMYLCNIEASEGLELKREWLLEFPAERIGQTWPIYFGVDYASLSDPNAPTRRDYFGLAVGAAIPDGGLVLIDGIYERMTQEEAERKLVAFANLYPTLQGIGFETLGKGEVAFNVLLRTTNLPLIPSRVGNMQKRVRYGKILAPAFQSGRIRLTDAPNAFIQAFRSEWLGFPVAEHDDALDAVFHLAQVAIAPLLTNVRGDPNTLAKRVPQKSPWVAFGKERR